MSSDILGSRKFVKLTVEGLEGKITDRWTMVVENTDAWLSVKAGFLPSSPDHFRATIKLRLPSHSDLQADLKSSNMIPRSQHRIDITPPRCERQCIRILSRRRQKVKQNLMFHDIALFSCVFNVLAVFGVRGPYLFGLTVTP